MIKLHRRSKFKPLLLTAFSILLGACGSVPKHVEAPTLNDLLNSKSMENEDRTKIVDAALARSKKELLAENSKAAVHFAKIAHQFSPEEQRVQLALAESQIAYGQYSDARQILLTANKENASAKGLELQGISEYFSGDIISAKTSFSRALKISPDLWKSAAMLGRIETKAGNYETAKTWFDNAMNHTDIPAAVFDHKGFAALSIQDWSQASNAFEEAQRLSSGKMGSHTGYRISKAKTGDLITALSLASDEDAAKLHLELAKIALEDGDRVSAIRHLQKSKNISPKYNAQTEHLLSAAKALKN